MSSSTSPNSSKDQLLQNEEQPQTYCRLIAILIVWHVEFGSPFWSALWKCLSWDMVAKPHCFCRVADSQGLLPSSKLSTWSGVSCKRVHVRQDLPQHTQRGLQLLRTSLLSLMSPSLRPFSGIFHAQSFTIWSVWPRKLRSYLEISWGSNHRRSSEVQKPHGAEGC